MKRELKENKRYPFIGWKRTIARLIPMKRELKEYKCVSGKKGRKADRKAHPDEKGTESEEL